MGFIKAIAGSIYSPAFYADALKKGLDRALGYFLLLALLLSAFTTAPLVYSFAREGQPEIKKIVTNIVDYYPSELEVKIRNGQVTTNIKEPYMIPIPKDSSSDQISNIIVIDTTTPFSLSKFNEYSTLAWLSKDIIYLKGERNEFRAYPLTDVENFTVNKAQLQKLADTVSPWISVLVPIVGVFIFIGMLFVYAFRLVYMFFLALCIYLLTRLMKRPLTYKNSYKIGLYAITLSLIIEIFQRFEPSIRIPFLFTIVALAVVFINLKSHGLPPANKGKTK